MQTIFSVEKGFLYIIETQKKKLLIISVLNLLLCPSDELEEDYYTGATSHGATPGLIPLPVGSSVVRLLEDGRSACPVCGKTFSRPFNALAHYRGVHTAELKHHCALCGNCFYDVYTLRRHVKVMHVA